MSPAASIRRLPAARWGLLFVLALLVSACGEAALTISADASPPERSVTPVATPDAAVGIAAMSSYTEAICPLFLDLLELDPRLAALREAGTVDPDLTALVSELEAVSGELRMMLNRLEAVPEWRPGQLLRVEMIRGLHAIRVAVLGVAGDPGAVDAADSLAAVPYIASASLDQGMRQAADAGLSCDGFE